MSKKYEAMVLSCMDPRFQKPVHKYLKEKKLTGKFSAFTIAGGSIGVTNEKFKKWHSTFWENLETSINLHKINKLVVITGISGSGKTSLAFDTIFAEGQRRYVESLSSYARQFLNRVDKPNVDSISGISPSIAVDKKRNTRMRRS